MTSTKYLIDNFENVKSKTVADFWIELANTMQKRFDCEIDFIPQTVSIYDYETIENYLSDNKIFELHFTLSLYYRKEIHIGKIKIDEGKDEKILKPMKMYIGSEIGHWLYLGVKKDLLDEEKSSSMKNLERIGLFSYIIDKREWRKDIFTERLEKIKLSDFSHQSTFDLIDNSI